MIGILDIAVLLVECPLSTDENTTRSWERHFPPKKINPLSFAQESLTQPGRESGIDLHSVGLDYDRRECRFSYFPRFDLFGAYKPSANEHSQKSNSFLKSACATPTRHPFAVHWSADRFLQLGRKYLRGSIVIWPDTLVAVSG
jgi:hypothetical protein